jgi:hypothetical protein
MDLASGSTMTLEENAVLLAPCASCGVRVELAYRCPTCQKDCCQACHDERFRSCLKCSTELVGMDAELKQAVDSRTNWQFFTFLMVLPATLERLARVTYASPEGLNAHTVVCGLTFLIFAAILAGSFGMICVRSKRIKDITITLAPYKKPSMLQSWKFWK